MNTRTTSRIVWTLWSVAVGLSVSAAVLIWASRHAPAPVALLFRGSEAILAITMVSVGLVIATRHPGHRIGWLFLASGVAASLIVSGEHYAVMSYLVRDEPLPAASIAGWLQSWVGPGGYFTLFAFLLLLFPTGRLPSRSWASLMWLTAGAGILVSVGLALRPGPVDILTFLDNPFAMDGTGGRVMTRVGESALLVLFGCVIASAIAFIVRFVRATGVVRQQLKWLAASVVMVVIVFSGIVLIGPDRMGAGANVLFLVTLVSIPICTAIAIVRHDLFDIDHLLSRTATYAIVTSFVAGVYAVLVVVVPAAFLGTREAPDWLVAFATLVAAGVFVPVRRRVQQAIDRRFFRKRYDMQRTIEAFAQRLREQIDIDALGAELCAVVNTTMQPSGVSVWLPGTTTDVALRAAPSDIRMAVTVTERCPKKLLAGQQGGTTGRRRRAAPNVRRSARQEGVRTVRLRHVALLLAVFAALLTGCGREQTRLSITARDFGFSGAPASFSGGNVQITFKNEGKAMHELAFIDVGDTPFNTFSTVFTKWFQADGAPFPKFLKRLSGAGELEPGKSVTTTITLPKGEYLMMCALDDAPGEGEETVKEHYALGMHQDVTVEGPEDVELDEPDAGSFHAQDYTFVPPSDLSAGKKTYGFVNDGPKQWHFMFLQEFPKGTTAAQAESAFAKSLQAEQGGPPPAGPEPKDVLGTFVFSPGNGQTFEANFKSGYTYLASCFIHDLAGGPPHAIGKRMYKAWTVT